MGNFCIVKLPLEVELPYIDNPAFDFYAPALVYSTLEKYDTQNSYQYVDFFQNAEVTEVTQREPQVYRFGSVFDISRFGFQNFNEKFDEIIIHYSCFERAQGLFSPKLEQALKELRPLAKKLILADMFDSSLHYLSYNIEDVLAHYPLLDEVYPRFFPYQKYWGQKYLNPKDLNKEAEVFFDFNKSSLYDNIISSAQQLNLIKDSVLGEKIFPFMASYGCPYNCSFCKEKSDQWNSLAGSLLKSQLLQLKQAGVERLYMLDPYANFSTQHFFEFLQVCDSAGISLFFTNGIGLKHINAEIAQLLKKLVNRLYVSPESLLETSLKTIRKPYSLTLIEEKIALLTQEKIPLTAHFVCNVPGESREEVNELFQRIYRMHQRYGIDVYVQVYNDLKKLHITKTTQTNVYQDFFIQKFDNLWLQLAYRNFLHQLQHKEHEKIIINVTYKCNNRCSFCATADRMRKDGNLQVQKNFIRSSFDKGIRLLDLDGGEPTLYPHLEELVQGAQDFDDVKILRALYQLF